MKTSNEAVHRAVVNVREAVWNAVDGTLFDAVYWAANNALDGTLWRAVEGVLWGAVDVAANEDPPHLALRDFLEGVR